MVFRNINNLLPVEPSMIAVPGAACFNKHDDILLQALGEPNSTLWTQDYTWYTGRFPMYEGINRVN